MFRELYPRILNHSFHPFFFIFAPFALIIQFPPENLLPVVAVEWGGKKKKKEKKFIQRDDKSRERSSLAGEGLYYFLSGRRIVGEFMDREGKWNRAAKLM